MSFNPLSLNLLKTEFFVPPVADHQFKITGLKFRKQKMREDMKGVIDIMTRIEKGNAETNGKPATVQCIIGTLDPSTENFTTDEDGVMEVNFTRVAQILHACFGYENNKEGDTKFAQEREGMDLSLDPVEGKLTGDGWQELIGCSFVATVSHRPGNKPGVVYPDFNYIRPTA